MSSEIKSYRNVVNDDGSSSTATYQCDTANWVTEREALKAATDPYDASLSCLSVTTEHLQGDFSCGKMLLTATYGKSIRKASQSLTSPFRFRIEIGGKAFKIQGNYHWDTTGNPPYLNKDLKPVKQVSVWKVVLYGTRSSVNLATYSSYADKVNSDSFLGGAAGTVLFKTVSVNQRQQGASTVYDIELHLEYMPTGHNKCLREEAPEDGFLTLLDENNGTLYASSSFAGLLT